MEEVLIYKRKFQVIHLFTYSLWTLRFSKYIMEVFVEIDYI